MIMVVSRPVSVSTLETGLENFGLGLEGSGLVNIPGHYAPTTRLQPTPWLIRAVAISNKT